MKRAANVAAWVGFVCLLNLALVATVEARGIGPTVKKQIPHPRGCPKTNFCGCGTAFEIFTVPVRALWVAANWFKFPEAKPAPGMVAVRKGHVFKIEKVLGPKTVLARNHNSKDHKSYLQVMSLAGYSVRNPRG